MTAHQITHQFAGRNMLFIELLRGNVMAPDRLYINNPCFQISLNRLRPPSSVVASYSFDVNTASVSVTTR